MNNNLTPVHIIPPFKRMCMTIGELPTSYLESMTYYEMLLWFTKYLQDTVIPTINNNGLAVEELQNKYVELKNYVDNYFENLDIQTEINNKLDDMAESGELTDIIAQYLGLAGMITFKTVSEMKEAENLVNGSKCTVLGYHSANDNGLATYLIRPILNTDVIDEGSIIRLNNPTLIAELIVKEFVTPENFGAYGDGIHDDTSAIQNSLKYNVIGKNSYKISNTINVINDKKLELNNLTYTGNNYAITIHGRFNTIKINNFESDNGGLFTTSLEQNTDQFIEFNYLEVLNSISGKEVLYINANENDISSGLTYYGVQYNIFKFRRCNLNQNANCNTVHFETHSTSSNVWINENSFYDCGLLSHNNSNVKYAYYANENGGELRDNKFYNSSVEGQNKGIYLGNSNINWYGGRFERSGESYLQIFERTGTTAPCSYIYSNNIISIDYDTIKIPSTPMTQPYFMIFSPFKNTNGTCQKIWANGIYETDGYNSYIEVKPDTAYGSEIPINNPLYACKPIIIKNSYANNYINIRINPNILDLPNFKICEVISEKNSSTSVNIAPPNEANIISINLKKQQKVIFYTDDQQNIVYKVLSYNKSNFDMYIIDFGGKSNASFNNVINSIEQLRVITTYNNQYIMTKTINRNIIQDFNSSGFVFSDTCNNGSDTYTANWSCNNGSLSLTALYKNGTEITDYQNVNTVLFYI